MDQNTNHLLIIINTLVMSKYILNGIEHLEFFTSYSLTNHSDSPKYNATVGNPESKEEQELLQELSSPLTGDAWIGYHLLLEIPVKTTCTKELCTKMLKTANNKPMDYGIWMKKDFNRIEPNHPRCYQFKADRPKLQKALEPTLCAKPLTLVCKSKCPRAGSPISPQPFRIQEQNSITDALMRRRKGMTIPEDMLNKTLHQKEILTLPELNIEDPGYQEKSGDIFDNLSLIHI